MPNATPLTDAINALTRYANETTGASDTTLSDAVGTLIDGYGGGGGGLTTIASGTFVGSNNTGAGGRQLISIGTKMARTDFYMLVTTPNGTEIEYSSMRKIIWMYGLCFSFFGGYDLSSNGNKSFIGSNYHINSNNSGTITERSCDDLVMSGKQLFNGAVAAFSPNTFQIRKQSDHFELYFGIGNTAYIFPSEITYNYEIVYFGTNPSTDIIEIS